MLMQQVIIYFKLEICKRLRLFNSLDFSIVAVLVKIAVVEMTALPEKLDRIFVKFFTHKKTYLHLNTSTHFKQIIF
jgi:hypothetical protein